MSSSGTTTLTVPDWALTWYVVAAGWMVTVSEWWAASTTSFSAVGTSTWTVCSSAGNVAVLRGIALPLRVTARATCSVSVNAPVRASSKRTSLPSRTGTLSTPPTRLTDTSGRSSAPAPAGASTASSAASNAASVPAPRRNARCGRSWCAPSVLTAGGRRVGKADIDVPAY